MKEPKTKALQDSENDIDRIKNNPNLLPVIIRELHIKIEKAESEMAVKDINFSSAEAYYKEIMRNLELSIRNLNDTISYAYAPLGKSMVKTKQGVICLN